MDCAAEQLLGKTLEGGWIVAEKLQRPPASTGGCFSCGYIVQKTDERAFLKALDFSIAFGNPPNMVDTLNFLTSVYMHERDLCRKCTQRRMSHVVNVLADGIIVIDSTNPAGSSVPYLIFELADGDIRSQLVNFDIAFCLRSLHHVAIGLQQLHGNDIYHQDIKPSNVLLFSKGISKLGDLGCAVTRLNPGPRDPGVSIAGDPNYAPPEQLYKKANWREYRAAGDLYLLGSMVMFLFAGSSMTASIVARMDPSFHMKKGQMTFEDALIYIRDAFGRSVDDLRASMPESLRVSLTQIVKELCDPDPELRGNPKDRSGHHNQYAIHRYVTAFDLLATRAERRMLKGI